MVLWDGITICIISSKYKILLPPSFCKVKSLQKLHFFIGDNHVIISLHEVLKGGTRAGVMDNKK
jgi:hypothetical protein